MWCIVCIFVGVSFVVVEIVMCVEVLKNIDLILFVYAVFIFFVLWYFVKFCLI